VSRAIDRAYRKMRFSQFARMESRSRNVCVDIDVTKGTLSVLAQRLSRGGTVEWETDDTEAFLDEYGKRHNMRQLAYMFTEELTEQVSMAAADHYRALEGEMIEATVVTAGPYTNNLYQLNFKPSVPDHTEGVPRHYSNIPSR
jgi:hypothetical protein